MSAQQIAQALDKCAKTSAQMEAPELRPEQSAQMARTHGLDKRLAEEQDMASTQKLPKHHSYASSTQDSVTSPSASPKGASGRYDSGANVHNKGGGSGAASRAPKPKTPAVAQGPASKSKQSGY